MNDQTPSQPAPQSTTASEAARPQSLAQLIHEVQARKQREAFDQKENRATADNLPSVHAPREKAKWTDIAIVILTVGIMLWAGLQWWEMHDAGKQTDKIIAADERLAKAMEDSVAQAKSSLDASIEISRNDERAWLGITRMEVRSLQPGRIEVNIPLQNSGKTAAVDVRTRSFVHLSDAPVDVPAFAASSHEPFKSRMTILPNITNANITIARPRPITEADITAIKNGGKFMYAFGEIRYKDVFEREHHTFFCGIYSPLTPNNLQYCNVYNGAD